jgi:CDP-2,3-bis-(O-geranylgeranyl)-sn-glycerol synthase
MVIEIIAQALWIIFPAYVANGSAVLIGGGKPIDFEKNWKDGRRLFGDGKTWRGLLVGTFIGMTCGFGLSVAAKYIDMYGYGYLGLTDFTGFPYMIPIVFSVCFGALLGDIIESFFKRRIGKKRGEDWIPFDQLDFLLGMLFFSFLMAGFLQLFGLTEVNWFFESFTLWHIVFLLLITPFFHVLANVLHGRNRSKQPAK